MSIIKCPDCSKIISLRFPVHDYTPCANHKPQKPKSLTAREANKLLQGGTVVVFGFPDEVLSNKKIRIIRARTSKGNLQGLDLSSGKWINVFKIEQEQQNGHSDYL